MKVEIWSDIICPFCYIGKRKFELALNQFYPKANIEIEWKSFQLDPEMEKQLPGSINQYLSEKKGMPLDQAKQMNLQVTNMAKEVGLDYHFENAIPNNTLLAHKLLHFAKHHNKQNVMKERLLQAYFKNGEDIGDTQQLVKIAIELGLDEYEAFEALNADVYANEVQMDLYHAQQIGVRGVPFFVFNNKYAISGAQPVETFSELLDKVWREENEKPGTILQSV